MKSQIRMQEKAAKDRLDKRAGEIAIQMVLFVSFLLFVLAIVYFINHR
jgi:hypothetical protein